MIHVRWMLVAAVLSLGLLPVEAQIPRPLDAPQPKAVSDAVESFRLPPGYRMELVASEPLVREPSGLCWDEQGRLYVCELHGYNLEGQYDIDELNRTGQLDREVRRVQANPRAKEAALAGTYGTVKRLEDVDGDGRMDRAVVLADRLPPCYGITPARGGLIVACAPDIIFLADRDGDGRSEVREKLFTGFPTGALERGINCPQPGYDHWLYFGGGHGGGQITGSNLSGPVHLPGSDFRIRPDGSAVEPIMGRTHTFGHAFTEGGDRFVSTTSRPGIYVTPLPWRYLVRNPHVPGPGSEQSVGDYTRVFPAAPPHPWRVKRAEDPGFFKYYRDRYGVSDSDPGGYFTSSCGPLVYQDVALPEDCRGAFFLCEPAQNLVHRARVEQSGPGLKLQRFADEQDREFLASTDQWFHPIHLAHGPDGAIWIVDMYREIIEDYSAVPRFLQQQYGLTNGIAHGRVWRLTHQAAPAPVPADMTGLSGVELASEVNSPHLWRRQTAARLLVERGEAMPSLAALAMDPAARAGAVLQSLYTLRELGGLKVEHLRGALQHPDPAVAVHVLRLADEPESSASAAGSRETPAVDAGRSARPTVLTVIDGAVRWPTREDPKVLLQLALSLGEMREPRATSWLARLAREHGEMRWMSAAVVSSANGQAGNLLAELLSDLPRLGQANELVEPLAATLGGGGDAEEIGNFISRLAGVSETSVQLLCLRGLQAGLKSARHVDLPPLGQKAFVDLLGGQDAEVRRLAAALAAVFEVADPVERRAAIDQAGHVASDLSQPVAVRLAAVTRLAVSQDAAATVALLAAWPLNTPTVREAIMEAIYSRRERLPQLMDALEAGRVPLSALSAFQRAALLEREEIRRRAEELLAQRAAVDDAVFARFARALNGPRDVVRGEQVFREHCATCHQVRGIGFAMGPDLEAEFQRAEEATLRDVLAPNDVITAGYPTYLIEAHDGQSYSGILTDESATSLILKQPAGVEQVLLRKDIVKLMALPVSLMPETLVDVVTPKDLADVIAWLRGDLGGAESVVLFEDEPAFVGKLTQGGGEASLEMSGAYSGRACLAVTPPQRYSARIDGWDFRIVEQPRQADEFRYLRLAWQTEGGEGVMVELAADGRWPDSKEALRRYYAGKNTTKWQARQVAVHPPEQWRTLTVDLWRDNGVFQLTGIAPTAMGGRALFDRIELLKRIDE